MESINQVYRTNDYHIFHLISENRDINQLHVERIKNNMKKKLMPSVLIVNENKEVIDGQHNLAARKALGVHVDYMVCEGLKAKDIPFFNVERSNWKASDYMKLYCRLGYKDYCKYADFFNKYGLGHNVSMQLCLGTHNQSVRRDFFNGVAKFKKTEEADFIATKLSDFLTYTKLVCKTTVVTSLRPVLLSDWYDHDWMIKNLGIKRKEIESVKVDDAIRVLEDVYNYRRHGGRVRFY